jgi:hypothetical protein
VVFVRAQAPEREARRRSRWSSLWWSGAGPLDSGRRQPRADPTTCQRGVGFSIGFDLNERVRTAILAFTVAPRAPSAPAPGRRTLTSGRRARSGPRAQHGRTVRLTRESVGRGSPYRARSGGTWEVSAWRRPIRSVVMVRSERSPARGCRVNERAAGSGPACPYLRKLSSKALLYRCAVSRPGCYRWVTAVDDRGLLGAVNALVRSMWWAREELNLRPLPCQKCKEPLCGGPFSQVALDRKGRS